MASLFPPNSGLALLPRFDTLLVKGPYPADAPFNLALSFEKNVIVISSRDRENNEDGLRASLQGQKLTGKIAALAEQVQIFYPPSAAHMALILSALQVIDQDHPFSHDASTYSPHLLRPPGPALVILHEPSAYFTNSNSSLPSSSYLSLLTRAVSVAAHLGASLAVFDAQIDHLRMPVYPDPNPHLERIQEITPLLENYIELIVEFQSEQPDGQLDFRVIT